MAPHNFPIREQLQDFLIANFPESNFQLKRLKPCHSREPVLAPHIAPI
jgi:hypothetical protein